MTCEHYNGMCHHNLTAENEKYWKSRPGIVTRIQQLSQIFTAKTFNGAIKVVSKNNKVQWMEWVIFDDNACAICQANATKGLNGWFKVGWFTPAMPAHPNCRCEWRIYWRAIEWV